MKRTKAEEERERERERGREGGKERERERERDFGIFHNSGSRVIDQPFKNSVLYFG